MMKRLLIAAVFLGVSQLALSQYALKNVFRSYMNDDDVMAWSINGDLAQYLGSSDSTYTIKSTIDNLDIIFFDETKDITESEVARINAAIAKDGYESLIKVKSGEGTVNLYGLEYEDHISQLYGRFNFQDKIGYILFKGTIYYEDLQHLNMNNLPKGFNMDWD